MSLNTNLSPEDESRLTAYALGELGAADHAQIEAVLQSNEAARQFVDSTRATAAMLTNAFAAEPAPVTDDLRRRALFERAAQPVQDEIYRVITHPAVNLRQRRIERLAVAAAIAITTAALTLICTSLFQRDRARHLASATTQPGALPLPSPFIPPAFVEPAESIVQFNAHSPREMVAIGSSEHPIVGDTPTGIQTAVWMAPIFSSATGPTRDMPATVTLTTENAFLDAAHHPLSTFFFTANGPSYQHIRQVIEARQTVWPYTVRIEELVNFFPYAYAPPDAGQSFAASIEVNSCPWQSQHRLVRIGLKAGDGQAEKIVAENLDIRVEFNPRQVQSYRLLGYDRRAIAQLISDPGKRNQIKAGRQVTALYEIVPQQHDAKLSTEPLRYQKPPELTAEAQSDELATVRLNYAEPGGGPRAITFAVVEGSAQPSADFNFAAAVAEFGLLLQKSPHKGAASYDSVIALAEASQAGDLLGERAKFIGVVRLAKRL
jgi:hypothetical protein